MNLEIPHPDPLGPVFDGRCSMISGTVGTLRKGGLQLGCQRALTTSIRCFPPGEPAGAAADRPRETNFKLAGFGGYRIHREFADRAGAVPDLLRVHNPPANPPDPCSRLTPQINGINLFAAVHRQRGKTNPITPH